MRTITEFQEQDATESVLARIATLSQFIGLGPPDLVHITHNGQHLYHLVTGVDCSSSASIAAYLLSRKPSLKFGTYCTWNPFSRVDVHVQIKVPGGVEAYALSPNEKQRVPMTDELWSEVYVAAILRALSVQTSSPVCPQTPTSMLSPYQEQTAPLYQQLVTVQFSVHQNQVLGTQKELEYFLETAHKVYGKRGKLNFSVGYNYLSELLSQYLQATNQHELAVKFFEQEKAYSYVAKHQYLDEKVKEAFALLSDSLKQDDKYVIQKPQVVKQQVKLLLESSKLDLALQLLPFLVEIMTNDPEVWLMYAKAYLLSKDYEKCLVCLNLCPVRSTNNKAGCLYFDGNSSVWSSLIEMFKQTPAPIRKFAAISDDSDVPENISKAVKDYSVSEHPLHSHENQAKLPSSTLYSEPLSFFSVSPMFNDVCDAALFNLKAANYEAQNVNGGRYIRQAYEILCLLNNELDWEKLLHVRAQVFIMEEEFQEQERRNSVNQDKPAWKGSSTLSLDESAGKRVCEMWLDALFTDLYQDIHVHAVFSHQVETTMDEVDIKSPVEESQEDKSSVALVKTPLELELLGDLCGRLLHFDQALGFYEQYLEKRYCFRIHYKCLSILLSTDGGIDKIAEHVSQLMVVYERWNLGDMYSMPLTLLAQALKKLSSQLTQDDIDKMEIKNKDVLKKLLGQNMLNQASGN